MADLLSELARIETKAAGLYAKCSTKAIAKALNNLIEAANEAELSHSGSWLGYQSRVYYRGLERPPGGALFDRRWGLEPTFTGGSIGEWVLFSHDEVFDYLKATKTKPSFAQLISMADGVAADIDELREELLSVIEACRAQGSDDYLDRMKEEASKARMISPETYARACAIQHPPLVNDNRAVSGGTQVPPHVNFRTKVYSIRSLFDSAETLGKIANRVKTHLSSRTKAQAMLKNEKATNVFIGHGRSSAWLELKNYIQDRLGLKCDDFNREATAGKTTVARLSEMLNNARFALMVLTAEDEQKDGKLVARQNVVHEAGLFQGRLGFEKAIVMLEEGCEQFSNIHGLGQIRFKKGEIKAAFHEVADTLKREGII